MMQDSNELLVRSLTARNPELISSLDQVGDLGRTSVYRTEFLETGVVKRTRTDPAGLASVTTEAPDGAVAVTAADGMTLTSTAAADPRYGFQAPYTNALTVRTPAGLQSTITTTRAAVLVTVLDPFSVTTLVDSTRVNGRLFTSTYDAATRMLTERTPLGRQSVTVVDATDRVVEERTTGLAPVRYTYDTRGRLLTSTQSGRTVTTTYAANGRVATVTDPLGRSSSYAYDSAGRVLTTTLPGGRQGAKNIALLVLVFIPLFLLLAGMLGRIGGRSKSDVLGDALVLFPGVLWPVLLGGLVYLGCLFTTLGYVGANTRVLAVALTPLIALGFVPFGMEHILAISHFLIAFALSLAVYGILVRLPDRRPGDPGGAMRDGSP